MNNKIIKYLDESAITISVLCAIHCLILPLIVIFIPTLGALFFNDEIFHMLLLYFIIPTSIGALYMGCKKHKNFYIGTLGFIGLAIVTIGSVHLVDNEKFAVICGSFIIIISHTCNFIKCRHVSCMHDHEKL